MPKPCRIKRWFPKQLVFACSLAMLCGTIVLPFAWGQDPQVEINTRLNEELDLPSLIEFTAKTVGVQIVYTSEEIKPQDAVKVTVRGPQKITAEQLFLLLKTTLRAKGLSLVPEPQRGNGWYRVTKIAEARPFAPNGQAKDFLDGDIFTEVFELKNVSTQEARSYLQTFVTKASSPDSMMITEVAPQRLLIITDFVENMRRIEDLVARIDAVPNDIITEFYDVKHMPAEALKQQLDDILSARRFAIGQAVPTATPNPMSTTGSAATSTNRLSPITVDPRINRVVLVATRGEIDQLLKLVEQIDVIKEKKLQIYALRNVSAQRLDEIVRSVLGEEQAKRDYQSFVDEDTNRLIVTAPAEIRQRIEELVREMDANPAASGGEAGQSTKLRFYKLKNVKAADVLKTIQAVESATAKSRFSSTPGLRGLNFAEPMQPQGLNGNTFKQLQEPQQTAERNRPADSNANATADNKASVPPELQYRIDNFTGPLPNGNSTIVPGEANVTVDENTNTLIVYADPVVQQLYEQLITKLDVRRPQVMIEARVIAISADDDLSIGVEVSGGDRSGSKKLFGFSSYGLSTVDKATGALAITPGLGFNGTLIDPESADVVLRALASHGRSRVLSSPRILVNDNATGELSSVSEVPFTSINAANTVSTTSFGGFAEAGTTIQVTPHISEGDYLHLEFNVAVNDFTGEAGAGIPPPRQTDEVNSEVTIPNGHTVIVGGLKRRRVSNDYDGIPILENIPGLHLIGGKDVRKSENETLFIFLKPVILRDDRFKDLRHLSENNLTDARTSKDAPTSAPILIR